MFPDTVTRKMFDLKRGELTGKPKICEEIHNLYPSPNIIRVIKSKRMRWKGHVVRMRATKEYIYILS
jgi:hypothetical protein